MPDPRPKGDPALLAAGWKFNTETGLYAAWAYGDQWMPYAEAQSLAFGEPEPPTEPSLAYDPMMEQINLLIDILTELKKLNAKVDRLLPRIAQ